jgi:SpoVK/Ycf46/Vps4 family AAA+-type ATPase
MDLLDDIDIQIKWKNHLEEINNRINSMWSYILYNNFCEKEIINLKNENNELRKNYEDIKSELCCVKLKNKESNISATRKRKNTNYLADEFKKIKRYKKTPPELLENIIKDLFSNLNSINDIIKLKNHPNKYDFIDNEKFSKLYNLIPVLEELNNIIGMDNVKDRIFRSICYFFHNVTNNNEMNHIMITGPPGVGKTTIAQIMGKIYLQLGFLENDTFITASRSDLIAKYLGQTADKTQKVIDSALGGVLFIDEVYSLGHSEQRDSFAKECIDTINLNMSRIDRPCLLIVGGYKEEVEKNFLACNKGLERRFTIKLDIDGYNEQELFDILMSFINEEQWAIEENAITVKDIKDNIKNFKYFGGDMRKLLQLAKENYCVRSMKTSHMLVLRLTNVKTLLKDDFKKALEHFKKKKEENTSHLLMYI